MASDISSRTNRRRWEVRGRLLCLTLAAAIPLCWLHGGTSSHAQTGRPGDQRVKAFRRAPRDPAKFQEEAAALRVRFNKAVLELSAYCIQNGLDKEAVELREMAASRPDNSVRLLPLPRQMQPQLPVDLPAEERYWRTQLRRLRQDYAKDLYLLSRRALNAGHVGLAFDYVHDVAVQDPDHAPARKILGYVRNGTDWVSPFEDAMIREKKVWHDQFGWIPKDYVERYERGERFFDRRWISAAKESEIRHDFENAWEVRTEHFRVRTNHSLERGVEFAKKLEDFHSVFFQIMAGYFNTQEQVQQLFNGSSRSSGPIIAKPHEVHFYRTRDEYIQVLKRETTQPIEITRGMYFPGNGIAFFFYDPESADDSTLYHEATHQLLSGSRPHGIQVGMRANFWIVEGIACYMESFRKEGDRFTVGDPSNNRIVAARHNLMYERYYVPLREMSAMGMYAFQTDKNIRKNYSQSAALAHFFMHSHHGRYRGALIEHLSQIYSPKSQVRDFPESLSDLTGIDDSDLDRQYTEYINALDPALANAPSPPTPAPDIGPMPNSP